MRGSITKPDTGIYDLCRSMTERSPVAMVAVEGVTHVIRYANPAFCQLAGVESSVLLGRRFSEAVPEGENNACVALLDRVFETSKPATLADQAHRSVQFDPVFWTYNVWAALADDGSVAGLIVQVTDTTERALARRHLVALNQHLLLASVTQLDLAESASVMNDRLAAAVRETNHRVKNSLQMLSSVLELVENTESNGAEIQRIRAHVRGMATVHELLTRQRPTDESIAIPADALLENLLAALQQTLRPGRLHLELEPLAFTGKQAAAVCIIVNEAVINSVKHGAGDVSVSLRQSEGTATLEIHDDGPGFPPGFDPATNANNGVELISMAARWDLRGSASFDNAPGGGARVMIVLPIPAQVTS